MATIETSRTAPFGAIAIHNALSALDTLRVKFSDWNNSRVTRAALSSLSDRELADIGLMRGDIERF